jgi:hypothetical protein
MKVRAGSLILSPAYRRQAQEERRRIRVCPKLPKIQKKIKFNLVFCSVFTPLESPSIYAGNAIKRRHQLLIEAGVKALSFLTGFTLFFWP